MDKLDPLDKVIKRDQDKSLKNDIPGDLLLPDPLNDRQVKDCPLPPNKPLPDELMFINDQNDSMVKPNWKVLKKFMLLEGRPSKMQVQKICKSSIKLMKREPNLMRMESPIIVVGDIHGQYYDLCHMLDEAGLPGGQQKYLFLGDYVDRGIFGLECVILLLSIKLNMPNKIVLLRGNHESRSMTENFTFRQETLDAYDHDIYELMMEVFDSMPISAVIDDRYLAMHGGISPEILKIDEINKLDRFKEVPLDGIMCDLLWADPMKDEQAIRGKFIPNKDRDCSFYFGKKPTKQLLEKNQLQSIIRGHQVQIEGFKMHKWDGPQSFPSVITLFSAPNYCGYYDNTASVLSIDNGSVQFKIYTETSPPYRLPDNMDVFSWSVPFLAQKAMSMMHFIVTKIGMDEEDDQPEEVVNNKMKKLVQSEVKKKVKNTFKVKLGTFSKVNQIFGTMSRERESILQIKNAAHDGKLPRGLLTAGSTAIKSHAEKYKAAAELDLENEKRPQSTHSLKQQQS